MSQSNVRHLAGLVRTFIAGGAMPDTVPVGLGVSKPLLEWLNGFQADRRPFEGDEASLLGLQTSPPLVLEVALSLRGRLIAASL